MFQKSLARVSMTAGLMLSATLAFAQMPNSYGAPINLETAKKVAAAAVAEVKKNNWTMAVAIVDTAGDLVYFEKLDGTQTGSVRVAMDKARSAALFKRPTKAWQDVLAAGGDGLRVLGISGAVPVEGGLPLLVDGKIVGAIGVSGGSSAQDGVAAKAGDGEAIARRGGDVGDEADGNSFAFEQGSLLDVQLDPGVVVVLRKAHGREWSCETCCGANSAQRDFVLVL